MVLTLKMRASCPVFLSLPSSSSPLLLSLVGGGRVVGWSTGVWRVRVDDDDDDDDEDDVSGFSPAWRVDDDDDDDRRRLWVFAVRARR